MSRNALSRIDKYARRGPFRQARLAARVDVSSTSVCESVEDSPDESTCLVGASETYIYTAAILEITRIVAEVYDMHMCILLLFLEFKFL